MVESYFLGIALDAGHYDFHDCDAPFSAGFCVASAYLFSSITGQLLGGRFVSNEDAHFVRLR